MNMPQLHVSMPSLRPPLRGGESEMLDDLLQDYLAWSGEALDVLVALYQAVDAGDATPPEAAGFAARIGAWEERLSRVLSRLDAPGTRSGARIAAI